MTLAFNKPIFLPENKTTTSEMIDIWVESDFYSLDSEHIRINSYTMTRIGIETLDI